MKRTIENDKNEGNSSSPLLFTPSQRSSKKRKFSTEGSSHGIGTKCDTQCTPGRPLLQSPALPEGAHGYDTSKRTKDDSFVTDTLRSSFNSSISFGAYHGKGSWLFYTPSGFKDSPVTRTHKPVSRRSLDRLIDPEVSIGWIESMATPPSDSSDKALNISSIPSETKDDVVSPAIATSNRIQNEPEKRSQVRRSVARVLFNQVPGTCANEVFDGAELTKDDYQGKNGCLRDFGCPDNIQTRHSRVEASSSVSDMEDLLNLSPTVVETNFDASRRENKLFSKSQSFQLESDKKMLKKKEKTMILVDEKNRSTLRESWEQEYQDFIPHDWDENEDNGEIDCIESSPPVVCNTKKARFSPDGNLSRGKSDNGLERNVTSPCNKKSFCCGYERHKNTGNPKKAAVNLREDYKKDDLKIDTFETGHIPADDSFDIRRSPGLGAHVIKMKEHSNKEVLFIHGAKSPCWPYNDDISETRNAFSPKRGGEPSEMFDFGPLSPTVVTTAKRKAEKCKTTDDGLKMIAESTPKPGSSASVRFHPTSKRMSHLSPHSSTRVETEALSPIQSDASPILALPGGNKPSGCPTTDTSFYSGIISEVIERALIQLEGLTNKHKCVEKEAMSMPFTDAFSPSSILPKTPARRRLRDSKRFSNRRSISSAKTRDKPKGDSRDVERRASENLSNQNLGSNPDKPTERIMGYKSVESISEALDKNELDLNIHDDPICKEGPAIETVNCALSLTSQNDKDEVFHLDPNCTTSLTKNQGTDQINRKSTRRKRGKKGANPKPGYDGEKMTLDDAHVTSKGQRSCLSSNGANAALDSNLCNPSPEFPTFNDHATFVSTDGMENPDLDRTVSDSQPHSDAHLRPRMKTREGRVDVSENDAVSTEFFDKTGFESEPMCQLSRNASSRDNNNTATNNDEVFAVKGSRGEGSQTIACKDMNVGTVDQSDVCMVSPVHLLNKSGNVGLLDQETSYQEVKAGIRSGREVMNLKSCLGIEKDQSMGKNESVPGLGATTIEATGCCENDLTECSDSSLLNKENLVEIHALHKDTDSSGNKSMQSYDADKQSDFDIESLSQIPYEDIDVMMKGVEEKIGAAKGNQRHGNAEEGGCFHKKISKMNESDKGEVMELNCTLDGNSSLQLIPRSCENDSASIRSDVINKSHISMDILDDLMFGNYSDECKVSLVSLAHSGNAVDHEATLAKDEGPSDERPPVNVQLTKSNLESTFPDFGSINSLIAAENVQDKNEGSGEEFFHDDTEDSKIDRNFNESPNDLIIKFHKEEYRLKEVADLNDLQRTREEHVLTKERDDGSLEEKGMRSQTFCNGVVLVSKEANCDTYANEKSCDTNNILSPEHSMNVEKHGALYSTSAHEESGKCLGIRINDADCRADLNRSISDSLILGSEKEEIETAVSKTEDVSSDERPRLGQCSREDLDRGILPKVDCFIRWQIGEQTVPMSSHQDETNDDALQSLMNSSFDKDEFTQLRDEVTSTSETITIRKSTTIDKNLKPHDSRSKNDASMGILQNFDSFPGSTTASGRNVDISEKALHAARNKLESDDVNLKEKDVEKVGGFAGFSTASGRKVDISEKALNAARKKLESDDVNLKEKDVEKVGGFTGFSTASGRTVNISEKALNAARKKLESDDVNLEEKDVEKVGGFTGFNTASGKKFNISEKSLNAARKKLESDDVNLEEKDVEKVGGFTGFSTASGKKVDISEKALKAARKRLESDDVNLKEKDVEKVGGFTGFSNASGRTVNISEMSLNAARKKLESDDVNLKEDDVDKVGGFTGFSTASGRKVDISEKSLNAARKRLESDDVNLKEKDVEKVGGFTGFSTASGRKVDISEKALNAARKKLESDDVNLKEKDVEKVGGFTGFSTASGRKVDISEKSLNAARKKLESDDVNLKENDVDKVGGFAGFSTASGRKVDISGKSLNAARKKLESDDVNLEEKDVEKVGGFTGFSTASGKKVDISEKALKAARKKLESDDVNLKEKDVEKVGGFAGFSTASGRTVNISEKALNAARKKLESDDVNLEEKDVEKVGGFAGFSTASGKKVDISEKALKAARKKLESDDVNLKEKDVEKVGGFAGFSTASGKKVDISEKALKAARKKLESDDMNLKEKDVEKVGGFAGLSTASGKKVDISEKALKAARKRLESDEVNLEEKDVEKVGGFAGFSTASGRKVDISEKSLNAARKKLESDGVNLEEKDVEKVGGFAGFSTASGKKVDISEKALKAARKKLESDGVNLKEKDVEKVGGFAGFSTASGKKVDISEKALKAARKRLESDDVNLEEKDVEKVGGFTGFSNASGRTVNISEMSLNAARKKLESDDVNLKEDDVDKVGGFTGFSTASGKKVDISEKALKAARKKLESDGVNLKEKDVEKVGGFAGFSTASGKKVDISEKALKAARKRLESDDVNLEEKDVVKVGGFTGFNTASGKKVDISEESLIAAKEELVTCEENPSVGLRTSLLKSSAETYRVLKDFEAGIADPLVHRSSEKPGILCNGRADELKTGMGCDLPISDLKGHESPGHGFGDASSIEMSERFDRDMEVAFEKNPHLLVGETERHETAMKHEEDKVEGMQELPSGYPDSFDCDSPRTDRQGKSLLSNRRKSLGMSRNNSFNFKGKLSNPSEFHNDRDAKHTIPLIPMLSRTQDFKSPSLLRTDLTRNSSFSKFPSTEPSTTPSDNVQHNKKRSLAVKSFSTPFKPNNHNGSDAKPMRSEREKLKRPLFACVPFGKRMKLDNVEEQQKILDTTRPKSGRLFQKKRMKKHPRLSQFTNGHQPSSHESGELQIMGLDDAVINICSVNAGSFVFPRYFFSEHALQQGETIVGDGAKLFLNNEGRAGLAQFQQAFTSMPGVDQSLISDSWLANQYRWIVWKLASMEKSFPGYFSGRCLIPSEVMYHMKYRYDKEIDSAERSAIKKILERDDLSTSRLVLCVSRILSSAPNLPDSKDDCAKDNGEMDKARTVVELTDGWYPIKAILDKPTSSMVRLRKITVGQKLCIYGANLTGGEQAVSPLEAPDSLMLELYANSTRRAHWDAKLGFQPDRRAFAVPLYSLFSDGGLVGCVDVVITRIYPPQWMEKSDTGCVFRNAVQEQKAAKMYTDEKHKKMEKVYQKIQKEFENSGSTRGSRKSRRRSNTPAKDVSEVTNGEDLYEILESAHDPGSLEEMLNDQQRNSLAHFRRLKEDKQRSLMQKKFDEAWKEVQDYFPERVFLPLQKFRVSDFKFPGKNSDACLTVWKPTEDITSSWKEGQRVKIYNLNASSSRYKHCSSRVQLATMNSTRYEVKTADPHALSNVYQPRKVSSSNALLKLQQQNHQFNEIDVIGYVLHIENQGSNGELQTVYLDDASGCFLAVKIWGGVKAYHLEEIVKPKSVVCFKNLVIKSDSFSNCSVTAAFHDLSVACSNPKELYFVEATSQLKDRTKELLPYWNDRLEVLHEKIRSGSRGVRLSSTPKAGKIAFRTTSSNSNNEAMLPARTLNCLKESESSPGSSALCDDIALVDVTSNDETEAGKERHAQKRLNDKKRKALEKYGEPSSLSPFAAVITPKTKRAFKPPSLRKKT